MQPRPEKLWHIELAVVVAIIFQVVLSAHLNILPKYFLLALEIVLLIGLHFSQVAGDGETARLRRFVGIALTAVVSFANIVSLIMVCYALIQGSQDVTGKQLLLSGVLIYITNVILFGLWYWQLDGGGPGGRGTHRPPVDFLFPQMNTPDKVTEEPDWRPLFFDYLYVSITNATAFSPTDTMPLTHRAKFLMGLQALVSLAAIALVAARAVNVLG
ncbi:MAG TPA: hypothetical protein VLF87_02290 [Patescibacteria group bacterium]|nr:hypothetical protein [Patescibacteria group bacterium]